jgi:hypothetical protein
MIFLDSHAFPVLFAMNVGLWCRLRAGGNQSGLLASFGEAELFRALATRSRPPEGRENCAVAKGKFFHAPRGGSCALHFTKCGQEPAGRGHV